MAKTTSKSKRWQRLGISEAQLKEAAGIIGEDLTEVGRYVDKGFEGEEASSSDWGRTMDLLTYFIAVEMRHLQFPNRFGDPEPHLISMSKLAVDYFFGNWREHFWNDDSRRHVDAAKCRKKLYWFYELGHGLWSSLLGRQEKELRQLVQYPETDLKPDQVAMLRRSEDDHHFLIVLARFIRDGSLSKSARLVGTVQKSRQRRPRMLLDCLTAIADENVENLGKALKTFMAFYKAMELDTHTSSITSVDGSILWNLAELRGLAPPRLEESLMDLIVTRESLGLK